MADIEKRSTPPADADITPYQEGETVEIPSKAKYADIGYDLFEQSHQYDTAQLEIDAIKVLRKLDFMVLPMVCFNMNLITRSEEF